MMLCLFRLVLYSFSIEKYYYSFGTVINEPIHSRGDSCVEKFGWEHRLLAQELYCPWDSVGFPHMHGVIRKNIGENPIDINQ